MIDTTPDEYSNECCMAALDLMSRDFVGDIALNSVSSNCKLCGQGWTIRRRKG